MALGKLNLKIVKILLFTLCFAIFILMMSDVFYKYKSKMTSSGLNVHSNDVTEKHLPFITFCPWPVKQNPGLHFTKEDFIRNSFELEEIFPLISKMSPSYTITNVSSIFFGQCFTLRAKVSSSVYQRLVPLIGQYSFLTQSIQSNFASQETEV